MLRTLNSVRQPSTVRRSALILEYFQKLKTWWDEVPGFISEAYPAPRITLFQRQRDVLNITYWHTIILVHRPLLVTELRRASSRTGGDDESNPQGMQFKDN